MELSLTQHRLASPANPTDMFLRTLALCAVEAVEGDRRVEQLGRWVTPAVLTMLSQQRTLRMNRNTVYRDQRRLRVAPGRILTSHTDTRSLNCSVVMHASHRSFAVTMRLEFVRDSWRATQIHVL